MNRKSIVVFMIMVLCMVVAGTAVAQSDPPDTPEIAIPVVTPPAPPTAPEVPITAVTQADQPAAPEAVITTKFTHQGQLKRNGALFNGACDMRFTLWDAAAAGTQLATYTAPTSVPVAEGVFAVEVDFGNQFKGEARWIQTEARCADDTAYTALPRVALNPAPYAIGLLPGAQMQGNIPGLSGILRVTNTGPGAALLGLATSTTGATWGVLGNAFSPNGVAVYGYSAFGAVGVRGESSGQGVGVWGSSVDSYAVYGESTNSNGVLGLSHNPAHGAVAGVHDGGGIAVYGRSTTNVGAYGESTSGWGVYGLSQSNIGVYGESTSFEGVRGTSHTAGHGGVVGVNDAAGGIAVYGVTPNGGYAGYFDGKVGIAGGSDLAELFNVSEDKAEPGVLLIIDAARPGQLTISTRAYDTKVAGIVSGAGGVNPGLTLHQDGVMDGDTHVAIAGRVYVKATASNGPIEPGDLLTTSDLPGHAMKATDHDRLHGAIVGKAMTGLTDGTGLVLVLVNLQ